MTQHPPEGQGPIEQEIQEALAWAEEWNLGNSRQERKIKTIAKAYRALLKRVKEQAATIAGLREALNYYKSTPAWGHWHCRNNEQKHTPNWHFNPTPSTDWPGDVADRALAATPSDLTKEHEAMMAAVTVIQMDHDYEYPDGCCSEDCRKCAKEEEVKARLSALRGGGK